MTIIIVFVRYMKVLSFVDVHVTTFWFNKYFYCFSYVYNCRCSKTAHSFILYHHVFIQVLSSYLTFRYWIHVGSWYASYAIKRYLLRRNLYRNISWLNDTHCCTMMWSQVSVLGECVCECLCVCTYVHF